MDGDPRSASRYRADIDGLRGVAVLVVVAFHAGVAGLDGGYVGVDVFFVLSGFLISGLLLQELEETGGISFRQFYARRIRRLLPASFLVLIATLLLGLLLYSPIEMKRSSLTASSAAFYVSNIFFAKRSTVYLDQALSSDPFLHTWSLAVEEQFYVLWPLVILLAACIGRRWLNARRAIAGLMVVLFVTSLALCIWLTRWSQPVAFFASLPRFWEFAVGGLAAMVPAVWLSSRRRRELVGCLGLVLIGSAVLTYDERSTFPGHLALVPVVGTALALLAGGSGGAPLVVRLLSGSALVWVGRRSYSWYLWHWPVLVFARVLWPGVRVAGQVLFMLGALVLAHLTLRLVENPIRYSDWWKRRPSLCLGAAVTVTALCFGAAHATQRNAVRQLGSAAQAPIFAASRDLPDINKRGCVLRFRVRWPKAGCSFANTSSDTSVVLFGDSHAGQHFPAVEAIALARHWRLDVYVKAACPSTMLRDMKHSSLGRRYSECIDWRSRVIDEIRAKKPALVITSNSNAYVDRDGGVQYFGISVDEWQQGTETTVGSFAKEGIPTVLVADTLRPGFDVPTCLSRAADGRRSSRSCGFERSRSLNPVLRDAEQKAIGRVPGASLVDLNDALCTGETCGVRHGDHFIYRDSNHITASFSRHLAPRLMGSLPQEVIPP